MYFNVIFTIENIFKNKTADPHSKKNKIMDNICYNMGNRTYWVTVGVNIQNIVDLYMDGYFMETSDVKTNNANGIIRIVFYYK